MASLKLNPEVQVGSVVAEYPMTKKIFEAFGIDYCCGGKCMLTEAAAQANVPEQTLIAVLQVAINQVKSAPAQERDWQQTPLEELMDHIVKQHHARLARELPYLARMLQKVGMAHGERHGEILQPLSEVFAGLRSELEQHLAKEEEVIFPAIRSLIDGICDPAMRRALVGLEDDHAGAGSALAKMREITDDYALPADACSTYASLYEELQELERDLHQHIHLENNILFPRTMQLVVQCEKAA